MVSDVFFEKKVLEFNAPAVLSGFKPSTIQINIETSVEGSKICVIGLPEDRHLYFLGYHMAEQNSPARFYLLHGSKPLPENTQIRPQLLYTDLGLESGYANMLETLQITGINQQGPTKLDPFLIFYNKGFDVQKRRGHKGVLNLSGTRLNNPCSVNLIYPGERKGVAQRIRELEVLERYLL